MKCSLLWDSSIREGPSCIIHEGSLAYRGLPQQRLPITDLTISFSQIHDIHIHLTISFSQIHDIHLTISIGLSTIMDHLPLHLKSEMLNPKRADFEIMAIIGPDTAAFKIANIQSAKTSYSDILDEY